MSIQAILHRLYVVTVSGFIAAVLLLQAWATFGPVVGGGSGFRFWPIVSYAMYTRAHYDGETVDVHEFIEGTLRDGSIVDISMESLKLDVWFYRNLIRELKENDPTAVAVLVERQRNGRDLVEIRFKSYPLMVTRNGPAEKPSEVLYQMKIPPLELAQQ